MAIQSSTAALYYPHSTIRDPRLIKNALLLWDSVDCIMPLPEYSSYRHPPVHHEALEIIVRDRIPTLSERRTADRAIKDLITAGIPRRFSVQLGKAIPRTNLYGIHPAKFLDDTWRDLVQSGYAVFEDFNPHDPTAGEFYVKPELGLLMMAALADACAGSRLRRITDRGIAYASLTQYTAGLSSDDYITNIDVSQVAPAFDRLITISLRVLNTDGIDWGSLIQLRRREAAEGGRDLARFRERYLHYLDEYVDTLANFAVSVNDKTDIEREFQKAVEDDLRQLKRELRMETTKLITKDLIVTVAAAAGTLITQIPGLTDIPVALPGVASVIPLAGATYQHRAAKEKILESHAMSWLYVLGDDLSSVRL